MKHFLRRPAVQQAIAVLVCAYFDLLRATMRWRFEQDEGARQALSEPEGGMIWLWHGKLGLAGAGRNLLAGRPMRIMASLSPDGALAALIAERLGYPAIRGSASRKPGQLGKGGAQAFVEAKGFIDDGGGVIITPDGPRGPREVLSAGPIMLAKRAGTRVYFAGLAARPAIALGSWDRFRLPLPFARGVVTFDGPFRAPTENSRADDEALRTEWQARIDAIQARAEALIEEDG
jgi:lysophospholipid acyltransferase (LPLAT)-like uncharacterized protein